MAHKRQKKKHQKNEIKPTLLKTSANLENVSKKVTNKKIFIFKTILFLLPFLYGLFFEFTAAFAGIVLVSFLVYLIIKNRQFKLTINIYSAIFSFIILSYLFVLPWSVDWGMVLIGFVKFSTVIIFALVIMQFEREEITDSFNVFPWCGCVMVVLSGITYLIPGISEYFIDAGRLGGFFQYANSFALFLIIGVIILAEAKTVDTKKLVMLVILVGGILLTGSRISLVILLCLLVYYAVIIKKLRKPFIIILASVVMMVFIILLVNGSSNAIVRITTIFTDSSTLLGRLLYIKDAWYMLVNHPFGVGHMGYYYLQPQFQTGVYTTRFVHQEFLQIGLDAGIPAMLAFIFISAHSLFSKKTGKLEKMLLLVILIHACLDFDLQYLIIFYILVMTLDLGESKVYRTGSMLNAFKLALIIVGIIYSYFFVALTAEHLGYRENALKMLPFHTEIKIYALSQAQTEEAFEYWSDEVLAQNKTIALAYEARAVVAANKRDYVAMVDNMERMLQNDPYNIEKYQEFLSALELTMNYYNNQGNMEKVMEFAQIALSIPDQLDKVKQRTSSLAYMINDKPELELTEKEEEYLINLKNVIDQLEKY